MSNMQAVLKKTSAAIHEAEGERKVALASNLATILDNFIGKLSDFSDIPEHYITSVEPQVLAQVKAIDVRTERAADVILTACEKISSAVSKAPDPIKQAVQNEVNKIFEASNFQDLVSQHANEIKLLAADIKADMNDIQSLTNGESTGNTKSRSRNKNKRADSDLLNGPTVA